MEGKTLYTELTLLKMAGDENITDYRQKQPPLR
jgi:hypothetical protein